MTTIERMRTPAEATIDAGNERAVEEPARLEVNREPAIDPAIIPAAEPVVEAEAPAAGFPARIELLGMPLDCVTEREALEFLAGRINARQGTWVLTPNLDILRRYKKEPAVRPLFHASAGGADILLADGMPLVWALRLAGRALIVPERVAGSGLVVKLAKRAAESGWRLFLLGGDPGAADRASAVLRGRHRDLIVAGTHCPAVGFEKDAGQMAEIVERLTAAKPDLVYVALGFPKQEQLIRRLRQILPHATFIGVGISLSFIAGTVQRAPRWVQRLGLEWMHRLWQEPRRLAKRYLLQDLPFALFTLFPRAVAARCRRRW